MSGTSRRLIVHWQSPSTREVVPVAELLIEPEPTQRYEFRYIRGVQRALELGFQPFAAFPELRRRYASTELFPFFRNRVMPTTRPDYLEYVRALDLEPSSANVAEILGRGRGLRQTDTIETVLAPERDAETGRYVTRFLVRAVRHVPGANEAACRLGPGDPLEPELEPDNPANPRARKLVSREGAVGYLPDYLVAEVDALEAAGAMPTFVVERVNPPPQPSHHRMLVRLEAAWPEGFRPLSAPEFEPLDPEADVA